MAGRGRSSDPKLHPAKGSPAPLILLNYWGADEAVPSAVLPNKRTQTSIVEGGFYFHSK
jgi:hypothetical protein